VFEDCGIGFEDCGIAVLGLRIVYVMIAKILQFSFGLWIFLISGIWFQFFLFILENK